MSEQLEHLIQQRADAAVGRLWGRIAETVDDDDDARELIDFMREQVFDLADVAIGLLAAVEESHGEPFTFNELLLEGPAARWAHAVARRESNGRVHTRHG